jgi:hypothetical protein
MQVPLTYVDGLWGQQADEIPHIEHPIHAVLASDQNMLLAQSKK